MLDKKEIITGFVSATCIFLTLFAACLYLLGDPVLKEAVTFSLAAQHIAMIYPLPFSQHSAFDDAERSLFSLLDPFSFRIDREAYNYLREESSGEYGGVGITVVARDTVLMVMSVREGSPAAQAGMKSGDLIIAVDSIKISGDNPASATSMIRGPSGTDVTLTVFRPEIADTMQLTLQRGNIKLEHLPYYGMTASNVAYVRIADFEAGAAKELKNAIMQLERRRPVGYIIDLKGNPGGYLNEAIDAADIFLDEDLLIVGTEGRSRWDRREYFSESDPLTDRPITVLTDRGTASAAEILTGALRGADRAVVLGDTTFGKGLVQSVYGLANREALRLTTSRYYFADGTFLNPPDTELAFSGLAPDIIYKSKGEIAFQEMILSGFLLYDFVEAEAEILSGYPDHFNYPDTVVDLFEKFVTGRGIIYESWLTETLDFTLEYQMLEQAGREIIDNLDDFLRLSQEADKRAFDRHADFLKFHIRRVASEIMEGRSASYRDVIVPGRRDIILASELLHDTELFESYLFNLADTE